MQTNSTKINLYLKSLILADSHRRARLRRVTHQADTGAEQIGGLVPVRNEDSLSWLISEQPYFVIRQKSDRDTQLYHKYAI